MERTACYCRVSTEEQNRYGLSLAEQEQTLRQYAKDHKMKVVDMYIDGGISARKRYTKRPELMRLLDDVKADKIDMILFIKLDRWFRNVGDYYEVQKILDDHHVTWRATEEDYETVTASGRFKVNIMLSVAQDEADRTSERIKFVFDGKHQRNEPTTGSLPRGYIMEGKHVALDPVLAPQVKGAFDLYISTGSPGRAIEAYPDLHLDYYSACRFFVNHAYTGDFNQIKIPPIITEEEYQRALETRKTHVRKSQCYHTYLFSGMLTCPACGHRLVSKTCRPKSHHPTIYYMCEYGGKTGKCTNNKCYREDAIEKYLLDHIDSKVEMEITAQKKPETKSYASQRDAVKKKINRLSDLYINDLIDMDEYKRRKDSLQAELDAIPEDEKPVDVEGLKRTFVAGWQDLYKDLPRESQQMFWRSVIDHITMDENGVADFSLRKSIT